MKVRRTRKSVNPTFVPISWHEQAICCDRVGTAALGCPAATLERQRRLEPTPVTPARPKPVELRSTGQPGAAVPTRLLPDPAHS